MGEVMVEEVIPCNTESSIDFELIDNFLEDCELRDYSSETIRSHGSNLRTIARFLQGRGLTFTQVDKHILRELLGYLKNERKVVYKTLQGYFSVLSSFYKHLNFEDKHPVNPVPPFMEHYLSRYKNNDESAQRKLISIEEMGMLINSTLEIRDKAVMTILAKTGVRRGELIAMDVDDIDWEMQGIKLKRRNKRSNLFVYFDDEAAIVLNRWLRIRVNYAQRDVKALFLGEKGRRIGRNTVYNLVTKHAERTGLHNPESSRLEDHFGPHCFRHWFTTNLRRNGMNREFIKELRGDSRREAVDIYDHIDHDELRKAYLMAIPRLCIV